MSTKHRKDYKEYSVWRGIQARCYTSNRKDSHLYFDKGIKVCDRWLEPKSGFFNFLADMGERPTDKHSIDRIDGSKGYSPDNCRWATAAEQGRNQITNKYLEFDGKRLILEDWAKITGIKARRIGKRLKAGWTVEEALTIPNDQNKKKIIDNSTGVIYDTIKLAAAAVNLEQGTVSRYLRGVLPNKTQLSYYNG